MRVTGKERWLRKIRGIRPDPVLTRVGLELAGLAKRVKRKQPPSEHEEILWGLFAQNHIQEHFVRQLKWHPDRKWTADFACERYRVLIEIDGNTWGKGAHTYGHGYDRDREKDCEAQLRGWVVLRFSGNQVRSGYALDTIIRMLNLLASKEGA